MCPCVEAFMRSSAARDLVRYTSCGFHCFDQCVLKVRIREGRIVAVEPDDTINPGVAREGEHPQGRLLPTSMIQRRPCPKGYAMAREIYRADRVIHPMKRVGERGEGRFQRISWEEALDTMAEKLQEVKAKYGPYSILHHPYSYLGRCSFPLAPWFGAGVAGWAAHSTNGFQEPQNWVFGKDIGELELTQDERNLFASRLIVLWGYNPVFVMNSGIAFNLLQARERGIPIICIEPRYTPTVEVLADQWIPIRPTTDVAMMVAMANVWFKEDLWDKPFVERWVEPEGLKRWMAYVLGTNDGTDKTPEWAERLCGVPAPTIREFARLYARSKPVNLNVGLSLGRQFYGENPARAAMYLQALTGNTCIPGGAAAAAESGLWWGPTAGPLPRVDWRQARKTYRAPVLMAMFKWAKAIDLRERLDNGEMSEEEYNAAIGNLPENPAPNIQMVILESNNHVNSLPDVNQAIRAMKKVAFTLVFAQYADHPSARYADILLPQIYSAFEGRNGGCGGIWPLFTTTISLGNYFIYRQKCVDPPGEVKPNDWVWTQVAKRLGLAEMYNPRMAHVRDEDWDEATEALYREAYEKWRALDAIAPLNPPSWEEFQRRPVFRFPVEGEPYYPMKGRVEAGENPFRGTPSGRIEFFSEALAEGPEYLRTHDVPKGSGKCYGGGALPPMAQMTMGGRDTFHSRDCERYPLLMSSPHSYYRVHSWLDNDPWLRTDCYRHAVWISVADAKRRGIKDNDLVRVFNDVGEMILPAYVTSRIVPGTVAIHHGGWYVPGERKSPVMPDGVDLRGSPNLLTHDVDLPDTVIGMFPCKGLVEIELWEER